MRDYGLTTVSEFLGDSIVYRNLKPMDDRLPAYGDIAPCLGMSSRSIPRKSEPDYARVMAYLLRYLRALDAGQTAIEHLIYIGDTRLNDGTAFTNLCEAGGWPGIAFIGSEKLTVPATMDVVGTQEQTLVLANRWSMLSDFDAYCRSKSVTFGVNTGVVLDLDKTTLGARGRNDHVINEARLEAVRQTVNTLLGCAFDAAAFEESYSLLNTTAFHPFTTDNQDYLAYVCLILGSDLFTLTSLVDKIRSGELGRFTQFMDRVEARSGELPERLAGLHADIYARVQSGDATPFKAFRYNEFKTTVRRMGQPPGDVDVSERLAQEIVLTQEVRELAEVWHREGALLFALSDKPDEASVPTAALAQQGYRAIHRTPTHAVGAGRELA